jgi:2-keto-4-pentenoate hydratase/2-oxohepta-3-ene-1,7-dioic acid hydratase in catechol pathway
MKLASFAVNGAASYGIVSDGTVVDTGAVWGATAPDLRSALEKGMFEPPFEIDKSMPRHPLDRVRLLPVIPNPGKILCIGVNYKTHLRETGREQPAYPMIFVRFAESQAGHGQAMIRPPESEKFDFEGELAVVIGKAGRRISKQDALAHVAGYSCYNDGSIRDWQRHTTQFTAGKNFPSTGAFGPWLVTRDEIPDPAELTLVTRLNGEQVQRADVSDLVFSVPDLIEYCSAFTSLRSGDVLVTGTTSGVGAFRDPPLWMKAGDRVEVEISRIGVLSNPIEDEETDEIVNAGSEAALRRR